MNVYLSIFGLELFGELPQTFPSAVSTQRGGLQVSPSRSLPAKRHEGQAEHQNWCFGSMFVLFQKAALPETNIAPGNQWLEDEIPFGARPIFRCELLVYWSFSMFVLFQN